MDSTLDLSEFQSDPDVHIWQGSVVLMLGMLSMIEDFVVGYHVESHGPRMWFLEVGFPLGRIPLAVGLSEERIKAVGQKIAETIAPEGHGPMWIRTEALQELTEAVEAVFKEVSDGEG